MYPHSRDNSATPPFSLTRMFASVRMMNMTRLFRNSKFILAGTTLVLGWFPRGTFGGVVTYNGTSFPEDQGWSRETSLLFADRSIEDGWLVQTAETVPYDGFLIDEDDIYRRSISEFAGAEAFFRFFWEFRELL